MSEPDVSLLGLGRMGLPMALNLTAAMADVKVWNRSAGRADGLASRGARVAATPADAAAAITLTVLTDLSDVEEVLNGDDGLLIGWRRKGIPRPILVVHGTVSPVGVLELGDRLASSGIAVVDAPLSGGVAGAEAGTLSIMVGGADHDVAKVLPVLSHLGNTVIHLGPLGSGELAKACNQIVVAGTIAALSEALVLADAAGLDRRQLLTLLGGGLASSEVLRQKSDRWISGLYDGGGSSANQLKDLRFIADAARSHGVQLPLARDLLAYFATAVELDHEGELDHSALLLSVARHSKSHDGQRQ